MYRISVARGIWVFADAGAQSAERSAIVHI